MTSPHLPLADLRSQRRRLTDTVARLAWLRRLVAARRDLEVARLTGVVDQVPEVERAVLEALALRRPAVPDLLETLCRTSRALEVAGRQAELELAELTDELVARLSADPSGCLANPAVPASGRPTSAARTRSTVSGG